MLSEDLKIKTETVHQETEKRFIPLLKSIHSIEEYARLLNWMHGYYQPLEQSVRRYITTDLLPDAEKRWRTDLLLQDINSTGIPVVPDPCTRLPAINSFEKALGALYVVEGSTLGGRIIATMLTRQLGSNLVTTWFSGYGNETENMWHSLKEFLDVERSQEVKQTIIAGAMDTFLTFKTWIEKHALQPQL